MNATPSFGVTMISEMPSNPHVVLKFIREWVFYIQGASCLLWVISWWIFVSDTPRDNSYISLEEVHYIEADQKTSSRVCTY